MPLLQAFDDISGFIETQSGLREKSDLFGILDFEPIDIFNRGNQHGGLGRFAQGSDYFIVAGVADQNDGIVLARKAHCLKVNFGYQRTSGVNDLQVPLLGFFADRRRDSVGAEDNPRALGDFG